jgi:hypothetical protein
MLTTAGVTADIRFDPTKITNRLKKSIQRQVASGVITGGYSSHASRLAKYLCKQFDLRYSDNSWYGVRVPSMAVEHREKFVELIHADLAAYLLDGDHHNNGQWDKDNAAGSIKKIRSGIDTDVRTHSSIFQKKLQALILETRTPEELAKANQVSAMLDAGLPITINQYNSED